MIEIKLSQGYIAIIDDEDGGRVCNHTWWVDKKKRRDGSFYVRAYTTISRKTILMHRFILGAAAGIMVDHWDRDGLNNRKKNLRSCTRAQNNANKRPSNISGFRGVSVIRYANDVTRYQAEVFQNEKRVFRGPVREDPSVAARDYDAKAILIHGEFAFLNFPEGIAA